MEGDVRPSKVEDHSIAKPQGYQQSQAKQPEEEGKGEAKQKEDPRKSTVFEKILWAAAHSPNGLPFGKHTLCHTTVPLPFCQDSDAF